MLSSALYLFIHLVNIFLKMLLKHSLCVFVGGHINIRYKIRQQTVEAKVALRQSTGNSVLTFFKFVKQSRCNVRF